MQLFELGEELRVGLAVSLHPVPHIVVNEDEETALCLDEVTQDIALRCGKRTRLRYAALKGTPIGVALSGRPRSTTSKALLRLALTGQVSLSAASYDERLTERRVVKMYHSFPPLGVEVLADKVDPPFWVDAPKLETAIIMSPGSGFRVHRAQRKPHEVFVRWNGFEMRVNSQSSRPSVPDALGSHVALT